MCVKELVQLQERLGDLHLLGVKVWAVSADGRDDARETAKEIPGIQVISDNQLTLITAFGVRNEGEGPGGETVAYPTHVLVDPDGIVRWVGRPVRNTDRLDPDEVVAAVRRHLPKPG
ncbi:MAG: hypothetical protein CMJ83_16130 [Planctomycetes bacterium]|nr:hypothetical protein [Planctomycetota bacterium]